MLTEKRASSAAGKRSANRSLASQHVQTRPATNHNAAFRARKRSVSNTASASGTHQAADGSSGNW